jgi:hypothetical protein
MSKKKIFAAVCDHGEGVKFELSIEVDATRPEAHPAALGFLRRKMAKHTEEFGCVPSLEELAS